MSQRKRWSSKAKFEIALQALKGELTLNEICTRYQVAPSQIHAWKKQVLEQGSNVFEKNDKAAQRQAIAQDQMKKKLFEKIGQLTVERDFLKKSSDKYLLRSDED